MVMRKVLYEMVDKLPFKTLYLPKEQIKIDDGTKPMLTVTSINIDENGVLFINYISEADKLFIRSSNARQLSDRFIEKIMKRILPEKHDEKTIIANTTIV